MIRIVAILGTVLPGNYTEKALALVGNEVEKHADIARECKTGSCLLDQTCDHESYLPVTVGPKTRHHAPSAEAAGRCYIASGLAQRNRFAGLQQRSRLKAVEKLVLEERVERSCPVKGAGF